MGVALEILGVVMVVLGLIGSIVPFIPSSAFAFFGFLFAAIPTIDSVDSSIIIIFGAIMLAIIALDYILPIYVTKRIGGSKSGTWGATIGMLAGFMLFPPLGIILCPFFGAVLGELINDRNDVERAFKVGLGTFIAFVLSTGIQFFYALYILWYLIANGLTLCRGLFA